MCARRVIHVLVAFRSTKIPKLKSGAWSVVHDWIYQYEWACKNCGAHVSNRETAIRPSPETRVGVNQVPGLRHLPIILDGNGDPVVLLSCDEVPVAIVMES